MNCAELYEYANDAQRRDAKQILNEFSDSFNWKNDGTDTILDIGCGSGNVTIDFILPMLPANFEKLVGSDLSEKMIRFAREKYGNTKIQFSQMDIGSNLEVKHFNQFNHITSFYCLHWVQNQEMALQNIYNMLKNGGNCLLTFLAKNPIFEIYEQLSKSYKYGEYMTDVRSFISPYQFSANPSKDFSTVMCNAGFKDFEIEIRDRAFVYHGYEHLKRCVEAVNPFLDRLPLNLRDEFFQDYVSVVKKLDVAKCNPNDNSQKVNDTKFVSSYKLIVCFARK